MSAPACMVVCSSTRVYTRAHTHVRTRARARAREGERTGEGVVLRPRRRRCPSDAAATLARIHASTRPTVDHSPCAWLHPLCVRIRGVRHPARCVRGRVHIHQGVRTGMGQVSCARGRLRGRSACRVAHLRAGADCSRTAPACTGARPARTSFCRPELGVGGDALYASAKAVAPLLDPTAPRVVVKTVPAFLTA